MQTVLSTHGLTKKYGDFSALDSVNLTMKHKDIYGLVGRNGAGKTTFFKCVMGLAKPTSGIIEIAGEADNLNKARQKMGFMINPAFYPYLNAKENLRYLSMVKGIKEQGEIDGLLELVGLAGVDKAFKAYSLGMKQRLGIAGALLGSPAIVVLDEPINGLDPQGIIDIREVIKDVHAQTQASIIISSHILSELDLVATRFGFIEQGVLVEEITYNDLHEQTKKSLVIEVNDVVKAQALLSEAGLYCEPNGNCLVMRTHLEKSNYIARLLFANNVEVFDMHRQETTLEDYFMRLIRGGYHA